METGIDHKKLYIRKYTDKLLFMILIINFYF